MFFWENEMSDRVSTPKQPSMIYSSESDIVVFIKGIVQSLKPYAKTNGVTLYFYPSVSQPEFLFQPYMLGQSLFLLLCNLINIVPPTSQIKISIQHLNDCPDLSIVIENSNINLIQLSEVIANTSHPISIHPLPNGTRYILSLPTQSQNESHEDVISKDSTATSLPQFYKEVQKRLTSYFTQTEKLMASLEKNHPHEAVFMQKVNTLIKVNLENEDFDSNSLCKAMFMSRTQLFRKMKALIRQAPANYIKLLRLQRAKELLETTDLTVSEVAYKSGFQTINHFTKVFKEEYGVPPSVYRHTNNSATNG